MYKYKLLFVYIFCWTSWPYKIVFARRWHYTALYRVQTSSWYYLISTVMLTSTCPTVVLVTHSNCSVFITKQYRNKKVTGYQALFLMLELLYEEFISLHLCFCFPYNCFLCFHLISLLVAHHSTPHTKSSLTIYFF